MSVIDKWLDCEREILQPTLSLLRARALGSLRANSVILCPDDVVSEAVGGGRERLALAHGPLGPCGAVGHRRFGSHITF